MRWSEVPRSTYLLGFATAFLAIAAGATLLRGTQTRVLLSTPAEPIAASPPVSEIQPTATSFAGIQEHALFYRSRTYHLPVERSVAPEKAVPAYELAGAFVIPDRAPIAVLKSRSAGLSRTVRPGDDLDGWQVRSIEKDRVVLVDHERHAEITRGAPTPGLVALGAASNPASFRMASHGASVPAAAMSVTPAGTSLPTTGVQPRLFRPTQR